MARRKREPMSEGKKNIIGMLLEEYDIKSARSNDYVLFTQFTKSEYEQNYDNEYTQYQGYIDGDEKYLVIENEYDTTYIWDNGKYILTIQSNLHKDSILELCNSTKSK